MPTITSSDIISHYASLGIRRLVADNRIVGFIGKFIKGEPDVIELPEPDWENRYGQYDMVIKLVDPCRDLPVERLSDSNFKLKVKK